MRCDVLSWLSVVRQSVVLASGRSATVKRGGVNPVWTSDLRGESKLLFFAQQGRSLVLLVTAMDEDVGSADDVIGMAELDVSRIAVKPTGFCRENVREVSVRAHALGTVAVLQTHTVPAVVTVSLSSLCRAQVEVALRETLHPHSPRCGSLFISVFIVADSHLVHYVVSKVQAVFRGKMARRRVLEVPLHSSVPHSSCLCACTSRRCEPRVLM